MGIVEVKDLAFGSMSETSASNETAMPCGSGFQQRSFNLRHGPWRRMISQSLGESLKVFRGLFLATLFLFCSNVSEVAMANDGKLDVLQDIQSANEATLMIIPSGIAFRIGPDERSLPQVACVYRIGQGAAMSDLTELLGRNILESQLGARPHIEVRVGIVFKDIDNKVMREFYFDDFGGRQSVKGYSGQYSIIAAAEMPDQFRALVKRHGVPLVRGRPECTLT